MGKQLGKRIQLWDAMRGVAILCMIVAHFSYVETAEFDGLVLNNFLAKIGSIPLILLYFFHANASFLAPFLFYFIIGIMCNIKFKKHSVVDFRKIYNKSFKLISGTLIVNIILILNTQFPQNIKEFSMLLLAPNVLFNILFIYIFSELVLHSFLNYYQCSFRCKTYCMLFLASACLFFNVITSDIKTYQDLPWFVTVSLGVYASLLGDYFAEMNIPEKCNRALISMFVGGVLAIVFYFIVYPPVSALKNMAVSYYFYCFGVASGFSFLLCKLEGSKTSLAQRILASLALMGRHSLVLYGVHFFVGIVIFRLVLVPFIPKQYWGFNILSVLSLCWLTAYFLDRYFMTRIKSN
ncbi:hypothetical protein GO013_12555 [Pseudodesulfovibrio sp. JC047]|uniref:hypothetical protein n=1 Tax=Pseudodesulfovibrio sp. JC047 TaxID=2683199 RepID=UPI0013CFC9E1|nr:hypothetical protein [Pseudodesulfovibrio sp. JC047]NDV20242.1 hypothetical protein [Pseudodesulfovibrio sp. JC047]